MLGDPVRAKIVETNEIIKSLKKLKRQIPGSEYASVVSALAREVTKLSDDPLALPAKDPADPDDPETRIHQLAPGFVLTYRVLLETENVVDIVGARILMKSVLRAQAKK